MRSVISCITFLSLADEDIIIRVTLFRLLLQRRYRVQKYYYYRIHRGSRFDFLI
jgi:hypothetical protein